MRRVYVIMRDNYEEDEYITTEPVDVVSSMTDAEAFCFRYESENPDSVYYWREVISSED